MCVGSGHDDLVAKLAAVAESPDAAAESFEARFDKAEVAELSHDCFASELCERTPARGTLQRQYSEYIGTLANAHVEAACAQLNRVNVGAPAREHPPAIVAVLPQRGVDEDACVVVQEQRVHDAPRLQRGERARLQVLEKRARASAIDLDEAHERKVEESRHAT